jgi:hypothetical protein
MEDQYYADRATLRQLLRTHPEWIQKEMAASIGRELAGHEVALQVDAPAREFIVAHGGHEL